MPKNPPTTPAPAAASKPTAATPAKAAAPTTVVVVDTPKAEPKQPGQSEPQPGTTQRLFPDWAQLPSGQAVPPTSLPKDAVVKKDTPPTEPKKEAGAPTVPPTPAPATEDPIDPEALKGKKIKLKIDGKEEIRAAEDILKGVQLESSLTQRAQILDQKEHALNEREKAVRLQVEQLIPHLPKPGEPPKPAEPDPAKDSIVSDDPLVKKLLQDNQELRTRLDDMEKVTGKLRYEESMSGLAAHVKTTTGFDDFSSYRPKMEQAFRALTPEQKRYADSNPEWWISQFLIFKNQDLQAQLNAPAAPAATPPSRPPAEPMPGIGGGGGAPTSAQQPSGWDTKYAEAFKRASESGRTEDWMAVLRLKEEAKSLK